MGLNSFFIIVQQTRLLLFTDAYYEKHYTTSEKIYIINSYII